MDDILSLGGDGGRRRWLLRLAVVVAIAVLLGAGVAEHLPGGSHAHATRVTASTRPVGQPEYARIFARYMGSRRAALALTEFPHADSEPGSPGPVQLAGLGARVARLLNHRQPSTTPSPARATGGAGGPLRLGGAASPR